MKLTVALLILAVFGKPGMQSDNFSPMVHTPSLVLERPFEAEFEVKVRPKQPDNGPEKVVSKGRLYRDSKGRRRQDITINTQPEAALTVTTITDPAAGDVFALDGASKTVSVFHTAPATAEAWTQNSNADGTGQVVEVDGLRCVSGQLSTQPGLSIEYSIALDLTELIFEKDARQEDEKTYRLFNISRTEPEAALFEIPRDYRVVPLKKP